MGGAYSAQWRVGGRALLWAGSSSTGGPWVGPRSWSHAEKGVVGGAGHLGRAVRAGQGKGGACASAAACPSLPSPPAPPTPALACAAGQHITHHTTRATHTHAQHNPQDLIRDKLGLQEMRASILLRAGRSADAAEQFRALLATNPDHYRWHEGLQAALGLRVGASTSARGVPGCWTVCVQLLQPPTRATASGVKGVEACRQRWATGCVPRFGAVCECDVLPANDPDHVYEWQEEGLQAAVGLVVGAGLEYVCT